MTEGDHVGVFMHLGNVFVHGPQITLAFLHLYDFSRAGSPSVYLLLLLVNKEADFGKWLNRM